MAARVGQGDAQGKALSMLELEAWCLSVTAERSVYAAEALHIEEFSSVNAALLNFSHLLTHYWSLN